MTNAERHVAEIDAKQAEGFDVAICTHQRPIVIRAKDRGRFVASKDGKGLRFGKIYVFPYQIRFGRYV